MRRNVGMNIGLAVRMLRKERQWPQEELAFRCHTTGATISRIEQGKTAPSVAMLAALAEGLGTSVHALIALAEGVSLPQSTHTESAIDREGGQLFQALPPEQKPVFIQLMRALLK